MAKKKLTDLYVAILKAVGLKVDEQGSTYLEEGDQKVPFTMKGKILCVPTPEFLKDPDWDKFQPFHPLSENIQRNKSDVLDRLTKLAEMHINNALTELLIALTDFASKKDNHKKANTEQKKFLRLWDSADAKSLKAVKDLLLKHVDPAAEKSLCTIFLRRDGMWKGEQWPRLAVIAFPIMDEQDNGVSDTIYGKKFPRVGDKAAFFELMRYIFPGIDEADTYNYGSKSPTAPYFHSLMMAFNTVFAALNTQLRMFEGLYPELTSWITPLGWAKDLVDLSDYKHQIDPLPGNEGVAEKGDLAVEDRNVTERREREDRAEKRDEYRRTGSSRYGRGHDDDRREEGWRGARDRRDDRDDDRDSRRSSRSGGGWRRSSGRDDRDYDDRDDRRGSRRSSERDRDDRYERDERRPRRGYEDEDKTSSGISLDFGTQVEDERGRRGGRGRDDGRRPRFGRR